MELQTNLAGISLKHPLMNAASTCGLLGGREGVEELARSAASAIMVGPITLGPRENDRGDTYCSKEGFSLKLLGIPRPGAEYYREYLPKMVQVTHREGKKLFVSVAGFNPREYAQLAVMAFEGGADLVELNLDYPIIMQDGEQKPIACFDPDVVLEILWCVEETVGAGATIAVKLSPFSVLSLLAKIVRLLSAARMVKVVTTMNTFPNAFAYRDNKELCIDLSGGLASLGGAAVKQTGLRQVKQLKILLPDRIDVVGVGGIATGQDVLDYLRAGATAVQIAADLLQRGPKVFDDILSEMVNAA